MVTLSKREILFASMGMAALAGAKPAWGQAATAAPPRRNQRPPVPIQKAKTTYMWQVPKGAHGALGAPNGLAMDERGRGFWYCEEEGPKGDRLNAEAILVDFNGKELKRLKTPASNPSGLAQGGGYVWIGSRDRGFFQVDIDTNEITQRDHPLTPPGNPSRSTHGMAWDNDNNKLWVADPQLGVMTRMDPKTFIADRAIKLDLSHYTRLHGLGYSTGFVWGVGWKDNTPGVPSTRYDLGHGGIVKYDINTGLPVLYIDFVPNSIDPHAMAIDKTGKIFICDAGFHPGMPERSAPSTGYMGYVTLL